MKKKLKAYRARINKTKSDLKKLLPRAKKIDVKVEKIEKDYEALIRIYIPPKKNLIAYNTSKSLTQSLERSKNTLIRKIKKIESSNLKRHFNKGSSEQYMKRSIQ